MILLKRTLSNCCFVVQLCHTPGDKVKLRFLISTVSTCLHIFTPHHSTSLYHFPRPGTPGMKFRGFLGKCNRQRLTAADPLRQPTSNRRGTSRGRAPPGTAAAVAASREASPRFLPPPRLRNAQLLHSKSPDMIRYVKICQEIRRT